LWALRLVYKLQQQGKLNKMQANALQDHLSGVRGLAAKQIAFHLNPLPVPFFHFVWHFTDLYLLTISWNSSVRFAADFVTFASDDLESQESYQFSGMLIFEVIGCLFIIFAFCTLRRIICLMINPYGDAVTDYELDFDLRGLWKESLDVVKTMSTDKDDPDLADKVLAMDPDWRSDPMLVDGEVSPARQMGVELPEMSASTIVAGQRTPFSV